MKIGIAMKKNKFSIAIQYYNLQNVINRKRETKLFQN